MITRSDLYEVHARPADKVVDDSLAEVRFNMENVYAELRPLIFSIAYKMLGSVSDAEDVLQESFLRYHRALSAGTSIESPKAFLSAVTTRLSIDHLRSARVRRETYPGTWLPEPLVTNSSTSDPAEQIEQADSLSMAFLLLLDRLTPVERAVFLLHDVFDYSYEAIASIIDKSESNCRQLASRARKQVIKNQPRFEISRERRTELATQFFTALTEGDLEGLVTLLAKDVVVYGDGGGVSPSWPKSIIGKDKVCRLLIGISEQMHTLGVWMQSVEINGQPGALFYDPSGGLINAVSLDIADGSVFAIRSVINPEKLKHIGQLSNVKKLLGRKKI